MIIGESMGLAPFDNIWYCDKCDLRFKDEDDFIYCPNCGEVLKNDWYQMALQSIEKCLNKTLTIYKFKLKKIFFYNEF